MYLTYISGIKLSTHFETVDEAQNFIHSLFSFSQVVWEKSNNDENYILEIGEFSCLIRETGNEARLLRQIKVLESCYQQSCEDRLEVEQLYNDLKAELKEPRG